MIGELRALLNDWDPVGVFQGQEGQDWPSDEYDCLHGLVLGSLRTGDSIDETARLLDQEFRNHFGLPVKLESCRSTAEGLHDWYRNRHDDPGKSFA
jgi:hypothetical protein